jgi:hypothetical protein
VNPEPDLLHGCRFPAREGRIMEAMEQYDAFQAIAGA